MLIASCPWPIDADGETLEGSAELVEAITARLYDLVTTMTTRELAARLDIYGDLDLDDAEEAEDLVEGAVSGLVGFIAEVFGGRCPRNDVDRIGPRGRGPVLVTASGDGDETPDAWEPVCRLEELGILRAPFDRAGATA